ncbi:MAG: hypothetical protein JWO69_1196 [Thermoleophilia bacterium]|nr:hypothetical protein [Thermoleophilia bacterium]
MTDAATDHLDEDARRSRLVMHLARLTQRGARVEEQDRYRAVVVVEKPRPSMVPNLVIAALGVGLFLWAGGVLFLLGAGMALLGWHRKLIAGAERVRLLVRVDDSGRVSELEMGTAA